MVLIRGQTKLTDAATGSFVSSGRFNVSTGLMHAWEGVMKSFKSVSVYQKQLELFFLELAKDSHQGT